MSARRNRAPGQRAIAVAAVIAVVGCAGSAEPVSQTPQPSQQPPATQAPGGRAGAPQQQMPVMADSIAARNSRWVADIAASIAGKENLPAEQVFKDIELLKGQSASRVLAIMNQGYSRALGVSCAHCHNPAAWESSERPQKAEARGMIKMVTMINEGNRKIPEFGDNPPVINCVVCHRGSRRPPRNVPTAPARSDGPAAPAAPAP